MGLGQAPTSNFHRKFASVATLALLAD